MKVTSTNKRLFRIGDSEVLLAQFFIECIEDYEYSEREEFTIEHNSNSSDVPPLAMNGFIQFSVAETTDVLS